MIKSEKRGRVGVLTIQRPKRRNALGKQIVEELESKMVALSLEESVSAIVLTGESPGFCAGSDLKELGALDVPGMVDHELLTARIARRIGMLDVPVIAAVEGYALGGGFILALSCDLVVSASDAKWSLPEVANGWLPPWGLKALSSRVGDTVARRLVWGYETLDGHLAEKLGVADYAVAPGTACEAAIAIAERLCGLPRNAVASTKQFFKSQILQDAELWDERASRVFADDCTKSAAANTLARFAEKSSNS